MAQMMESAYPRTMHPKNRHQSRYDLKALSSKVPALASFVIKNKYGDDSIDFASPEAVKSLNEAILKFHYDLNWTLPSEFLCPPIPGRADYIHYLHDLLSNDNKVRVLDVGVGANCIYPLLGFSEYKWDFVGSDINPKALAAAQNILEMNPKLKNHIELRLQKDPQFIFKGIIQAEEQFTFTMCNPPFHSSLEEATAGTERKWKNLGKKTKVLNFGGLGAELWTEGGEKSFIKKMIEESVLYSKNVRWFTTLVSKEDNLPLIYKVLKNVKAREVRTLDMTQGQKKSRVVAWNF